MASSSARRATTVQPPSTGTTHARPETAPPLREKVKARWMTPPSAPVAGAVGVWTALPAV